MSKRETLQMVSEMTDLYFGYTAEATTYFENYEKAFNWLYLSEDNPHRSLDPLELIQKMTSITVEEMQELEANTLLEYMVKADDHTFITPKGIGYLRILK